MGISVDKFTGVFLGTAIGDALGAPTCGMRPFDVYNKYQYVDNFIPTKDTDGGRYTGVTQFALMQAMAMLSNEGKFNPAKTRLAIDEIKEAHRARWRAAIMSPEHLDETSGMDATMIVLPLALKCCFKPIPDIDLLKLCSASLKCAKSQADKKDVLASYCVAWCIKELIRNSDNIKYAQEIYLHDQSMIARLSGFCRTMETKAGLDSLLSQKIDFARKKADADSSTEEFVGMIGNGWHPEEFVPFSLFCFMKGPDDISSVFAAATAGGCSSLNAAIIGALIGAYVGAGFLKENLKNELENSAKIIELSRKLWETWSVDTV